MQKKLATLLIAISQLLETLGDTKGFPEGTM